MTSAYARRIQRGAYLAHLKTMRASSGDIKRILSEAADDAQQVVASIVGDSTSAAVRRAQMDQVVQALRQNQEALWGSVGRYTQGGIARAAADAGEGNVKLSAYLANIEDDRVKRMIVRAAESSTDRVRANVMAQIDLSRAVYKNGQVGTQRARRVVEKGIAQNLSAKQLADNVRHLINPNTRGGTSYAAMRLARTEINHSFHASNTLWHNDSPFVETVEWNLSGSHPVEDECDEYAREVWLPHEVPDKPHPQCFCYTTAGVPDRERFVEGLASGQYDSWLEAQGERGVA